METFAKLFERFLVFVYHCFDRIVIQGYLPLLTRPEHIVHFFRDAERTQACARPVSHHPVSPGQAHLGIPRVGRRLRPQPQNSHAKSGKRREQRGLRPASSATHGAEESTRSLLHLHQHGNGQHVYLEAAQVSHRGSQLPHHPSRPVTLPALLLLYPRSGDRSSGHAARTQACASARTCPFRRPTI
jgi:hypothetical protein